MAPVNTIESLNTGSLRKISDPGGGGGGTNSEKMANTTSISRKISSPSCQALQTAVSTLYRMDDFDIRKVLDWNYYIERLGGTIQKIITIC